MKRAFVILMIVIFTLTTSVIFAEDDQYKEGAIIADTLMARPLGIAAIGAGSAIFVLSLPFAILTGGVGSTARLLVKEPVRYTLFRPLGDFERQPVKQKAEDTEVEQKTDSTDQNK